MSSGVESSVSKATEIRPLLPIAGFPRLTVCEGTVVPRGKMSRRYDVNSGVVPSDATWL
jgi:hypothetical protein